MIKRLSTYARTAQLKKACLLAARKTQQTNKFVFKNESHFEAHHAVRPITPPRFQGSDDTTC